MFILPIAIPVHMNYYMSMKQRGASLHQTAERPEQAGKENTMNENINIINAKEAADETINYMYKRGHNEIFYNKNTGEVIVIRNSEDDKSHFFDDPDIIKVMDSKKRMTAEEIERDIINELKAIEEDRWEI